MSAILAAQQILWDEVGAASKALQQFPSGPMGLTPDSVKASAEFKTAKANYEKAFATLRLFNTTHRKQLRAERIAQR